MRPFFAGDAPQLQLLTQLEQHPEPVTVTALADKLNWDRNTVSRQLQRLQAALRSYNPQLQLTWDVRGVHYWRQGDFNLGQVVGALVGQSYAGQLLETLLTNQTTSLAAFALHSHLSESTVRRTLTEMAPTLTAYGISVDRKAWQLRGAETAVRYLAFQYYWNTYGTVSWPFAMVTAPVPPDTVALAPNEQAKWAFWVAISTIRQQRGHQLDDLTEAAWLNGLRQTELLATDQWWQVDGFVRAHAAAAATLITAWLAALPPRTPGQRDRLTAGLTRSLQWARRFGTLPLLTGGTAEYQSLERQSAFQTVQKHLRSAGLDQGTAYWQLRQYRIVQAVWPELITQPELRVALAVDLPPIDRTALGVQLQQRYQASTRVVATTDLTAADLVLTNYNVATQQPTLYVTVPLTPGDWQRIDQTIQRLLMNYAGIKIPGF